MLAIPAANVIRTSRNVHAVAGCSLIRAENHRASKAARWYCHGHSIVNPINRDPVRGCLVDRSGCISGLRGVVVVAGQIGQPPDALTDFGRKSSCSVIKYCSSHFRYLSGSNSRPCWPLANRDAGVNTPSCTVTLTLPCASGDMPLLAVSEYSRTSPTDTSSGIV